MDKYIGRLLDNRYEILEVIGTGGMAVVYKARCHRLNRLVAVKILKDEYSQDEEFRRRFHAEGQAVAMLSHPNIVAVYDVSTADDADYIVMELIDGISLKQYMEKKGVLNWKEPLHFAVLIAKALEHAHSRGIVHRDIKPHNVMVLKNGSVKVADFGIARVMSKSNTLTKEALGSVHYISPEQAKGGRVYNRSDIYSLGVVMYEMMTGRPPYDGESPVAVAIQHINGGAPLPTVLNPNIPGGLEQIIMKAMALEPDGRYTSATEMLYDMDEFRKNPVMLFDYHNTASSIDDATMIRHTPLVSEEQTPAHPRTTAERVAGTNADAPKRRPEAKPVQSQQRKRKEEQAEENNSKIATIAIISCSVVAVLAIVIFLITLFDGGVLFNKEQDLVEVPNLIGEYVDVAEEKYTDFEIVRLQPSYSDEYEKDQIMDQLPEAGDMVDKGAKIHITVSLGEEPQEKLMVDLENVTEDQAIEFLTNQGLVVLPKEESSETIEAGRVTRTDPAKDEPVEEGQTVTIWVSTGPAVRKETMPNVVGRDLQTALTVLSASGFDNVEPMEVESNRPKGEVLTQSVQKNEKVDVNTQIVLEISMGPAETTAPETTEATTTPTQPVSTKRQTIILPVDRTETYELSIKQDGVDILDPTPMEPTAESVDVELTGSGVQYFDIYIDGVYYQTIKVDFSANG